MISLRVGSKKNKTKQIKPDLKQLGLVILSTVLVDALAQERVKAL